MSSEIKESNVVEAVNVSLDPLSTFEKYKKVIIAGVLAVVVIVGGWVGFSLYQANLNKEAAAAMYRAQMMFEKDSLDTALKGSGDFMGFLDVADQYSWTQSGKLASYYVGAIYLQQKNYEQAIAYLDQYSSKNGLIQARAWSMMGDAYAELNDLDNAIKYYKKASGYLPNEQVSTIYMIKLGLTQELAGKFNDAISTYDVVIKEYPRSQDVTDAKKYKARATSLAASKE
ncbi:MAG: tetratricopeptide repeat protein [Cytophagaceae bacterium]|jgi:tetratricopeptide (TPR) repeat protein|nr:tetratricopeptide repeat protein [Cytophagaceae bacterium]